MCHAVVVLARRLPGAVKQACSGHFSATIISTILGNMERMRLAVVYLSRQTELEEYNDENNFDISRCCHGNRDGWTSC